MKVIVIGANHAGTHSLLALADNYGKNCQITAYDRNNNISFLGCGMALWIGNVIDGPEGLFYANPQILKDKGINVCMEHELVGVDFNRKEVQVRDLKNGQIKQDSYDKLIIAMGSLPISPLLPGMYLDNVVFAKLYQNAEDIIKKIQNPNINRVAVVGAGYIGVELVEAFKESGKEVVLINDQKVLNNYYDEEFQNAMEENLCKHGIQLALGELVTEIKGDGRKVTSVVTNKNEYPADLVLMSIGFKPNTGIFKNTGLELAKNGAIVVNEYQQTSIPDVYAVGDCSVIRNNAINDQSYIALATNAVRTGLVAGHNVGGTPLKMQGVQGSNAIHIYGLTLCSTGLTETVARKMNIDCDSVTVNEWLKPTFMKDNDKVKLKVVWDKKTRRILGAQIMSTTDITLALHVFSLAIQEQYSIDKLALLDLFFLPHFNQPVNFITKAGLMALTK